MDSVIVRSALAISIDADMALEYQDTIPNKQLLIFNAQGQLVRKNSYGLEQAKAGRCAIG